MYLATIAVYLAIALLVRSTSRGAEIESGDAAAPRNTSALTIGNATLSAPIFVPLQNFTVQKGVLKSITVGSVTIDKAKVKGWISTLEIGLVYAKDHEKKISTTADTEYLKSIIVGRLIIEYRIAELQKLADALAQEGTP